MAVAVAALVVLRAHDARTSLRGNPFAARPQYDGADPALLAAAEQAAADGDSTAGPADPPRRRAGRDLADPERYPTPDDVAAFVGSVVADASAKQQTPVLVVYGVPDRDCTGGQSERRADRGGIPALGAGDRGRGGRPR